MVSEAWQKQRHSEWFHKSLKSNTGLAKSHTRTVRTQNNYFFASIFAYFELELLKCKTNLNHFALAAKLYLQDVKAGPTEFNKLQILTIAVT
jgi:hypothetical protein